MTGSLSLQSDSRMHFVIRDANGLPRAYIWKDKGGDGLHINNGSDGGGEFVFGKNSEFYSPSHLHAGSAMVAPDGNVYGTVWGGWLNNNVNGRATWDWVNQNFVQNIRLTTPIEYSERGLTERVPGGVMTSWADYGGSNYHIKWRLLQKFINGQWVTADYT
ncbi:TPA: hypothetical protein H2W01_002677 [Salmonella enterica]|nr:hypothetical protein [Salmonella enterica]